MSLKGFKTIPKYKDLKFNSVRKHCDCLIFIITAHFCATSFDNQTCKDQFAPNSTFRFHSEHDHVQWARASYSARSIVYMYDDMFSGSIHRRSFADTVYDAQLAHATLIHIKTTRYETNGCKKERPSFSTGRLLHRNGRNVTFVYLANCGIS